MKPSVPGLTGVWPQFVLCSLISLPVYADTFYVNQATGNDANAGTSPGTAVATITQGVTLLSDGDTLTIGPGTYSETSGESYPLLLSGNLEMVGAGPNQTILDGEMTTNTGVISYDSAGDKLSLSGLAIINGARGIGAGLDVSAAAEVSLNHCRFEKNVGGIGGGLIIYDTAFINITDCRFTENAGTIGGAMQIQINAELDVEMTVRDSIFQANTGIGSAIHFQENGGGMHHLAISRSRFSNNSDAAVALTGTIEVSTGTIANSLFVGNTDTAVSASNSNLRVVNTTFVGNNAALEMGSGGAVVNSIFWDNVSEIAGSGGSVNYSLVQGLQIDGHNNGSGNLNTDPQLDGTFHLAPGSPAIDKGVDAAAQLLGLTTDLDGDQRFYNRLKLGRPQGVIDMGADEWTPLFADGFEN